PYNGTTTTCEALSMGVPVVSLRGQTHASRVGLSLLSALNLADLVADSPDSYVALATSLARDPARLAALPATLPPPLSQSPRAARLRATLPTPPPPAPPCDRPAFADRFQAMLRDLWRLWCTS